MLSELSPVIDAAMRHLIADGDGGELGFAGDDESGFTGDAAGRTLCAELHAHHTDALLLGTNTPFATGAVVRLLDEHPRLKIVCITPDGRHAVLHERRLGRIEVADVSFATIFATLRTACAAEAV